MPLFSVIKNGQINRVVTCPSNDIESQLVDGESYILGGYDPLLFELVNALPILRQAPLQKYKKPSALRALREYTTCMANSGFDSEYVLASSEAWTKEDAKKAIDLAAGKARFSNVSSGTLIGDEYQLTINQVTAWRNADSPINAVPLTIQSWANATGLTAELAAQNIESTAAAYETTLANIRDIRLTGKAAVEAETGDFVAVAKTYIDQLNAI
jgi:hypothetical protein